jgi:hypothetical protein
MDTLSLRHGTEPEIYIFISEYICGCECESVWVLIHDSVLFPVHCRRASHMNTVLAVATAFAHRQQDSRRKRNI